MITLFSSPKAFRGHIKTIQINAIQSWLKLSPLCEVILIGNEEGTADVATQFGIRHVPNVECTEFGTPLVKALFREAERIANYEIMCYVNCDIILMSNFLKAVKLVKRTIGRFLMVGQRHDVDVTKPLNFSESDWEDRFLTYVNQYGKLHPPCGIDYFIFPRGQWPDIPPFAIGRACWDNWMLYYAHSLGIPVIDASASITAVHQNHDYSHYPGGKKGVFKDGPEVKRHLMLLPYPESVFTISHATWIFDQKGLRQMSSLEILRRQIDIGRSRVRRDSTLPPDAILYFYVPRWQFRVLLENLFKYLKYLITDRTRAFYYKVQIGYVLGKMFEFFLLNSRRQHNKKTNIDK